MWVGSDTSGALFDPQNDSPGRSTLVTETRREDDRAIMPTTAETVRPGQATDDGPSPRWWWAALEVTAAALIVILDILQPTLVILGLLTVSLLVRRGGWPSIGLTRPERPVQLAGAMAGFAIGWTALHLLLFMPIVERVMGARQDVSGFESIEGNLAGLLGMLVLSWSVAAVGEEVAYRGYILTRMSELFRGRWCIWAAVLLSSGLFGLAHTEQGAVGVALSFIDGVAFALIRLRTGTLWAAILAHGFMNTIGFVAFYFLGPIHALW